MTFMTRSISAAAAMTAVLIFGAQAQAQTTANPPTNAQGGAAVIPKGPESTSKSAEQRDMKKPMAKEGDKAGVPTAKGGAANMPAGGASKAMTDKSKMDGSTTSKGKSGQPAGAAGTATGGAAITPAGPNTSTKDAAGTSTTK